MERIKPGIKHSSFPIKVSIGRNMYSFCVDCRDVYISHLSLHEKVFKCVSAHYSVPEKAGKDKFFLGHPVEIMKMLSYHKKLDVCVCVYLSV